MATDSSFYAENVADALSIYNMLAAKFSAPDHNFTWEDGKELHSAYETLQEARKALARYENANDGAAQ